MKAKMFYLRMIVLSALLCGVFAACEDEDKIPAASYQPGVWFYSTKSVLSSGDFNLEKFNEVFSGDFSFYFYPEIEVDTFKLPEIRLMGTPVDYDRKVNLVCGEGTTAVEGVHFEIVDAVLPAHAISFIPKILLIKKNLGEEEKIIKFRLQPSEEFPARVFADTISDDKTFVMSSRYELKFSNLISKPTYWEHCSFGAWSQVKYEFMIEKLGRYWGIEPLSPTDMNDMYNDVLRMRYELEMWKRAHNGEQMKDENGKEIYF